MIAKLFVSLVFLILCLVLLLSGSYFIGHAYSLIGERPFWMLLMVFGYGCALSYGGGQFFWAFRDMWLLDREEER